MKKLFTVLCSLVITIFLTGTLVAQIFTEDFESGTPSTDWGVYRAGEENVTVVSNASLPIPLANGGDYVGLVQDADGTYSGASIILAGSTSLQDYAIEGDVFCYAYHPDGSAYTGLAVYSDSSVGTYIKLAADFDADQRLRLYNNHLDATFTNYTFHHAFTAADVPGGIPQTDGWHHMKVEVKTIDDTTTAFWCYFDGQQLLGCPVYDTGDDRMSSGQFGLYSFQMDGDGIAGYFDNIVVNDLASAVDDEITSLPEGFYLGQNYPNPFNPETKITYQIFESGFTSLGVFDLLGREIRSLVNEDQSAGSYTVTWDGRDAVGNKVPSGIYLYTLKAGNLVDSKKMILLK